MRTRNMVFPLVSLSIFALAMASFASKPADPEDEFQQAVSQLKDKKWIQVNREPFYISSQLDALCRAASPEDYRMARKSNPHAATSITVFVNDVGRKAMFSQSPQQFPAGAIIVKAKFERSFRPEHSEGHSPILYTIMIKRAPGYNPEAGDWEFAVVSGDGKKTEAAGKLANCMACHASRQDTDFVFRSYLTAKGDYFLW